MAEKSVLNSSSALNRQPIAGLFVLLFLVIAVYALLGVNREAAVTFTSGFLFGYILQRARFCFAAGFRDIFLIRNTALTRAILLLLLLTGLGFFAVHLFRGEMLPAGGIIYPVGLHTVAGGILFGFGLVIAGNCVSGCLMRMGEGYLMQWITFCGLMVGSAFGAWHLVWWGPLSIEHSPTVFLPELLGWPAAISVHILGLGALYLLAAVYERGSLKEGLKAIRPDCRPTVFAGGLKGMLFGGRNWSYTLGAVALALVNIMTFYAWGRPGAITSGLTHLAGWLSCRIGFLPCDWYYFENLAYLESRRIYLEHPLLFLSAGLVAGSFFASLLHREFRIRRIKSYRFIISALFGGFLLGYSSRVAMGCNFGGFWGGLSSFSLHGWVFGLFILLGAYLGGRAFMRYLI